ncbi:MAG: hypothetical protein PWQ67_2011 [Clostridia bacterium]|nr:hypothetical protein [Clostridia bacterium]MDN5323557.1 hypothetical protein [Clostridia bacterium]
MKELNGSTKLYILIIEALALLIIFTRLFNVSLNNQLLSGLLVFTFFNILSDQFSLKLPKVGDVSVSFPIQIAALILFGPLVPMISEFFSTLIRFLKRKKTERYKEIFNGSQLIVSIYIAGLLTNGWMERQDLFFDFHELTISFLVSLIYFVVNTILVTIVISLSQKAKLIDIWTTNFRLLTPHYLTLAPLGFIVALIYYYIGIFGIILFLIPLLLARHSFKLYLEMRENYLNTIETLVKSIEAKDVYTCGHSERVARYSVAIGKELGLDAISLEQLNYLALLHDIGKVAVSDKILNKMEKLNDEEFNIVKHHPEIGAQIAKNIKLLKDYQNAILHHHERWDGVGYPSKLKGEDIPLFSRIIAVADSFDAMTSDRPYRKALEYSTAINEITLCSGKQFDPQIVNAFIKTIPEVLPEVDMSAIEKNLKITNKTNLAYLR